ISPPLHCLLRRIPAGTSRTRSAQQNLPNSGDVLYFFVEIRCYLWEFYPPRHVVSTFFRTEIALCVLREVAFPWKNSVDSLNGVEKVSGTFLINRAIFTAEP
ncbi:MAG TPA: hypothetical protein VFU31_17515, partial [Candidatus Binatia bacterium]|nr:hypothetical protein [Candidatus Binatia bacterium]